MPRVLLLFEYPTLSGGERSMLPMIDGIRAAGFDVVAAAPPDGPLADALRSKQIPVEPLLAIDECERKLSLQQRRSQLTEFIRRTAPDLLHANSLSMTRVSGPVAAQLSLPSIGHIRDIVKLSAAAVRDVNRHARLIAVSQATRDWHERRGVERTKLHVVYNGVKLDLFHPREPSGYLHREVGISSTVPLVGCIGQIGMRKGLDTVMQAARELLPRHPDVHFVIVGQRYSEKAEARRFEADLRSTASSPPLRKHVHFLGQRDDVHLLMNELTVLLHAAHQEPLGRVLLEAAAAGTPFVATNAGGTPEIIPPSYPLQLLAPGDFSRLATQLDRLLRDDRLRLEAGQLLRQIAERRFDVRRATETIVGHYAELLDR